jgi:hypothetical protein
VSARLRSVLSTLTPRAFSHASSANSICDVIGMRSLSLISRIALTRLGGSRNAINSLGLIVEWDCITRIYRKSIDRSLSTSGHFLHFVSDGTSEDTREILLEGGLSSVCGRELRA